MTQVKIDSKFTIKIGDQKMALTLEELCSLKVEIGKILTPPTPTFTIAYEPAVKNPYIWDAVPYLPSCVAISTKA